MRVKCENCNTNFNLDEGLVKSTGSKVRCSKCKHVFVVYPPPPTEDEPVMPAEQDTGDETFVEEAPDVGTREDSDVSAPPVFDEASSEETAADDMDLSDIEKMIDVGEKAEAPAAAAEDGLPGGGVDGGAGQESLDLSDIEKILDEHDDSDELLEEKSDEDRDLVFDLDEDVEMETGEEAISPATELDLGDLEKMFEPEEEPEPSTDEEPSLSLDVDTTGEQEPISEASDELGATEGLDFEEEGEAADSELEAGEKALGLDMESIEEDGEAHGVADKEEPPTLDLYVKDEDIALEEEPEAPEADAQELDLEATMKIDSEAPAEEAEELDLAATMKIDSEAPAEEVEELDLAATMKIDSEAPGEEEEEVDLAATIKIDSEALSAETEELDLSMEDVSEISDIEETEMVAEEASSDDLEIELEGEDEQMEDVGGISEEALESEAAEDELPDYEEDVDFPDDAVPDIPDEDEAFLEEEEDFEDVAEEEEDFEEMAVQPRPKGAFKKFVLGLLTAVLLIVLVLAALVYLRYKGIDVPYLDRVPIPFLSKQKTSAVTGLENLKIDTKTVENRPLNSEKAGRLFIITGMVKNESSIPHSYIQVSGSLYTPEKKVVNTATSYCGNVIADMELDQMTPAAIRTRLGKRSGENNSNENVAPGKTVPFMIVFFDVQESLDECGVAVVGSTPGRK